MNLPSIVSDRWQYAIENHQIQPDAPQAAACKYLDTIVNKLDSRKWYQLKTPQVKGLYLWGGVGRGKSFLTSLFLETLGEGAYERWHFHRFMTHLHQRLDAISGTRNPIPKIVQELRQRTRVLCLDELFVEDIGDAMLLATVFQSMFEQGITLITTSNCHPEKLYHNGLQREKFLPAIASLLKNCDVVCLEGRQDWRMQHFEQLNLYLTPLNQHTHQKLQDSFSELKNARIDKERLIVNGRSLEIVAAAGDILWISFKALCCTPTSARDYVELAKCFHTILIEGITSMSDAESPAVVRFIHLIDELYDRRVNVIISADAPIDKLYLGQQHRFAFDRTESRLIEMQSAQYIAQQHIP